MTAEIFQSYLMGGFECSTHRGRSGRRNDLIAATAHDRFARHDYQRLIDVGIRTARDGARWHLIEHAPYQYDFSSVAEQVSAARATKVQIIWDLFHYGYPDDLDIFSPAFVSRFTSYAARFTEFLLASGEDKPLLCLVNEISFFAWAGGTAAYFYPFKKRSADKLKKQLIRATISAAKKVKEIAPGAVLIQTDPVIRVIPRSQKHSLAAKNYHNSQYHAIDVLLGRTAPEFGGSEQVIDVIGINYYPYNQWRHPDGEKILPDHPDYHPFSSILEEFYARYQKPLFIAETGVEDDDRPAWFKYICEEVKIAEQRGVPVDGICLYPIVNHPGWDDDRHCHNGLWDYPDETGSREIYQPLADEIARQMTLRYKTQAG